jgi:hypothetical protein
MNRGTLVYPGLYPRQDPGPIPLHCYYRFTFTCFIYILAYYYLLLLDTLNPLFTANW